MASLLPRFPEFLLILKLLISSVIQRSPRHIHTVNALFHAHLVIYWRRNKSDDIADCDCRARGDELPQPYIATCIFSDLRRRAFPKLISFYGQWEARGEQKIRIT